MNPIFIQLPEGEYLNVAFIKEFKYDGTRLALRVLHGGSDFMKYVPPPHANRLHEYLRSFAAEY